MKTVLEVIQATASYFAKHGVESPRLSIEHLLAHVLGKRRMDLYLEFDRSLNDQELEPLRDLVRRRASGEPLQHLLGTVEFLGRVFFTDKRALIPRPETEQLCEMLLERYKIQPPTRVIDVGTGTGVIALSLAAVWPDTQVEAVDISEAALELAQENGKKLGMAERVKFYRSDLLGAAEGAFDLIVANLPYISGGDIAGLAREVQFDPRSALDGGPVGNELINRLISEATHKLNGEIALEIGEDQASAVCEEFSRYKFQDTKTATDYQGRNRFVFAKYG